MRSGGDLEAFTCVYVHLRAFTDGCDVWMHYACLPEKEGEIGKASDHDN